MIRSMAILTSYTSYRFTFPIFGIDFSLNTGMDDIATGTQKVNAMSNRTIVIHVCKIT